MVDRLRGRLGDDRQLQPPADDLGNVSNRHTLLRDRMIAGSRTSLLERQPVKAGSVEPMHRGPAVAPVADERGDTLLASYGDHVADEALPVSVVDLRKTD